MPGGHEHGLMYSLTIYARFSGQFFFTFSKKKNVMGKKDRCAVFGCNNDRHFPEKYMVKDHTSFFEGIQGKQKYLSLLKSF